jgi:2-oxoglutarate ferredoxin oxidoreductase subunit gamma
MGQEVIMAGFGGQGVMLIGELLAYAGMVEGKQVSWMPAYGPEMRGGTANCSVVVTEEDLTSPVVTEPTSVIIMNKPSLDKFEPMLRKDGVIVINTSLVDRKVTRTDLKVVEVPCNDIAAELGNARIANMVALGALIGATGCVSKASVMQGLKHMLPERHHRLLPLNEQAIDRGIAIAQQ